MCAKVAAVRLQVADCVDADARQRLLCNFSDSVQRTHRQRAQEIGFSGVVDDGESVGLFVIARQFCQQLVGRNADGCREFPLLADGAANFRGDGDCGIEARVMVLALTLGGEIGIRFIHGYLLNEFSGEGVNDFHHGA